MPVIPADGPTIRCRFDRFVCFSLDVLLWDVWAIGGSTWKVLVLFRTLVNGVKGHPSMDERKQLPTLFQRVALFSGDGNRYFSTFLVYQLTYLKFLHSSIYVICDHIHMVWYNMYHLEDNMYS